MRKFTHHTARLERQRCRKLRKTDKRAMDALIKLHGCDPARFERDDGWHGGRIVHWTSSYIYESGTEWDCMPATDELMGYEINSYQCDCIDGKTGDFLPDDQCPPCPPSALRKAPEGWRWRGGRLVPVDKHGAMVRAQEAKQGEQASG